MRKIHLALVHFPVLDRAGERVTTAITNLDLHDMSRSARTYGVEGMFVVHPVEAQRTLAARIQSHWVDGSGRRRIPDRALALELIRIVPDLASVHAAVGGSEGRGGIEVWSTAAASRDGHTTAFSDARSALEGDGKPVVLLFGTGWGLAHEVVADADVRLEPIVGRAAYNHLSVRAACAICLDRLVGAGVGGPRGPGTGGALGT